MLSPVTVIGGAGLTGRLVASSLREHGAKVRVLTPDPRRARSFLPTEVSVYRADVRDSATLTGLGVGRRRHLHLRRERESIHDAKDRF